MVESSLGNLSPVTPGLVMEPTTTSSSFGRYNQPPIPIGVYKLRDNLPDWLQRRPTKVLPVESAVAKARPHKAPQFARRVVVHNGEENEYEGLLFTKRNKPSWFVIPPEKKVEPLDTPFHMNGAKNALKIRQDKARPVPPTQEAIDDYLRRHPEEETHLGMYEVEHDAQEIFTLAAWQWIRKILLEEGASLEEELPPLCYREVYLNDFGVIYDREATEHDGRVPLTCGQVDIYGTLADNQGVIIDFGAFGEEKELQVLRQYQGTKKIIEEANHNQSPPITKLIGSYFTDHEGVNIIHLHNTTEFTPLTPTK